VSACIYNSRDSVYKAPFGAVATGEAVRFTIHLPKLHLSRLPVLKLCEVAGLGEDATLAMEADGGSYSYNSYTCTFTPASPALYLYHFEVQSGEHTRAVRRGEDGLGVLGDGGEWQLTVYDSAAACPSFLREGVLYQIFPDRFYNSGGEKQNVPGDRALHGDWLELPRWRPDENGQVKNDDYFGGDLKGIEEKLPYLHSLGVTALYLNPVFEAHANHRYNTADYSKIDPLLGTNGDFRALCAKAMEFGISILIDGVFSHTGSDSLYFNKEGRYGPGGAWRDPQSPYRKWYRFREDGGYESWWGFDTLPNVNETTPSYLDFICGDNGILRQWLSLGAAGFRLDVADELPDEFLDRLHDCVKGHSPDNAIIGEVWEDASNKMSYGVRRRYLLGGQLDSVMNYPFKDAILTYVRHGGGAAFLNTLLQILENYPRPAIQSLMNSLSTHDTVRAITELGGKPVSQNGRDWQEANHELTPEEYLHGHRLFRLASILQFGLPGIPCVYYGDEAGLCGYKDPFNRTCYPWGSEDKALVEFIRALGRVRRDHPIFSQAIFNPISFSEELCCFTRELGDTSVMFCVNRSIAYQNIYLPERFRNAVVLVSCEDYHKGTLGPLSGVVLLAR